ncbi:VOC family protein [Novosphingobium sp. 1949]|uniref:VOC family protein n=1 Tax=Novosphingobium organovorum TaxID=2930092 RepID=A0ABT0BDX6_9SPHN|nr:VOC family protein [Novosphingobium organovorum]MCJ2183242.1 VOC family protein [Novosphingobium organovorum]
MTRYLHTMIRVTDPDATIAFFALLGLQETRRMESEKGRFTLIYLAAPGQEDAEVELTYNWPGEDGSQERYEGGRNFGHLAFGVADIYATCRAFQEAGVTVNRPPRDGHMAFVRTPDGISIELLQQGDALAPQEPWASMENTGVW